MLNQRIKIKTIIFIIGTLIATPSVYGETYSQGDMFYSWVDNLAIRDNEGKKIDKLNEYESVIYLGEHSRNKESLQLRGKNQNDYRYLVKTHNNKKGWVYGGGLKKVKITDPKFNKSVLSCFNDGVQYDSTIKSSTKKQQPINGLTINKYIDKLEGSIMRKDDLVYERPILESGCLGTLNEICYVNSLKREYEGAGEVFLFDKFPPFAGIKKGTSKKEVQKTLGDPIKYNQSLSIYESSYIDQDSKTTYSITIYFNESQNVESISIEYNYNEDC